MRDPIGLIPKRRMNVARDARGDPVRTRGSKHKQLMTGIVRECRARIGGLRNLGNRNIGGDWLRAGGSRLGVENLVAARRRRADGGAIVNVHAGAGLELPNPTFFASLPDAIHTLDS